MIDRLRSSDAYLVYARAKHGRERIVDADTDLVLEGFPRSANTFAVEAFKRSNPGVRLAHHVHSAAQITGAIRHGVPALVLSREPRAAIASWMVYDDTSAAKALKRYLWFYEPLVHLTDRVVVADFQEVIRAFGDVIARVNDRYGTSFAAHAPDAEETAEIFAAAGRVDTWKDPRRIPAPTAERAVFLERAARVLEAPELAAGIARAEGVYAAFGRSERARMRSDLTSVALAVGAEPAQA